MKSRWMTFRRSWCSRPPRLRPRRIGGRSRSVSLFALPASRQVAADEPDDPEDDCRPEEQHHGQHHDHPPPPAVVHAPAVSERNRQCKSFHTSSVSDGRWCTPRLRRAPTPLPPPWSGPRRWLGIPACVRSSSSSSVRAVFARISSMPPIIFLGGKSSGICSNMSSHQPASVRATVTSACNRRRR